MRVAYLSLAGLIEHFSKGEFDITHPESSVLHYVKTAAEIGHPRAYYIYAYFLDTGYGGEKNRKEAMYYYACAYVNRDIDGMVSWMGLSDSDKKLAKLVWKEKERPISFSRCTPEELFIMGCNFIEDDEEKDYEEGLIYLQKAYERGYKRAVRKLAECYYLLKNYDRAKEYWKSCAEQGDEQAAYELGYFCLHGFSPSGAFITFSSKDRVTGSWESWLLPLCNRGHMGAIYEYVLAKNGKIALETVNEWIDTAIALESKEYYKIGIVLNLTRQTDRALEFFNCGANEDAFCAEQSGIIYENKKQYEKALEYYKKAYGLAKYELKDRLQKTLNRFEENKCQHCGAYYSAEEKKTLFGVKKVCSICGKKIK